MNGMSFKKLDWTMLGTILILIGLSAAFIFSAQFKSDADLGNNYLKQLGFAGLGGFLCLWCAGVVRL